MALRLHEVFNTELIGEYHTEDASRKQPYLGSVLFPSKKKMGIDIKWLKTHKGLGVALKPSNFDAIPTVRPRGKAEMTKEEMPLFRESMIIKESDMIELSRAYAADDPYLQPVLDSIYDDANNLIEGAEISAEKMRMQLLAPEDGKMQITVGLSDNTMYSYDYDGDQSWKGANFLDVSSSDAWDNKTSKPLDDIQTAIQKLADLGVTATGIIGTSTTFNYLLGNEQVQNAILSITGKPITFLDSSSVREVLSQRLGLQRIVYDKKYTDYDGVEKKFYPDNYVTIIGSGQLGSTWRGTTPEELTTLGNFMDIPQAPVDITVLDSGIAVAIQNEYKPAFTATTTVSQIVLPSFEGMDGIFVIKVKSSAL